MNFFQTPAFLWGMAVIIGITIAIVVFTEIIDRLRRNNHPLTPVVELFRNIILGLLAVLVLQRMIIGMDFVSVPVRLVSTAFWLFMIVFLVRLSNVIFTEGRGAAWHDGIPRLFKRLPLYAAVILILWYLLQRVWSLPLNQYAAALGLGSIAVAFALQDTLSNLVSGLFILFNRPFSEGEWIHIGDTEGRVLTVNWRYTSIETRNGDVIVFPNGSISNASITNHSQPQPRTRVVESIVVAYVNPPNKVKRMFMETMLDTPGILAEPVPVVAVTSIDDPLMGYEVRYWIEDYAEKPAIHNAFMTRIWYAARRHDVALPSPAYDLYHYDGPTVNREAEVTPEKLAAMLRGVETFARLSVDELDMLAASAQFREYAVSEVMVEQGDLEEGLSIIIRGEATLTAPDGQGVEQAVEQIGKGAVFGEMGLFGRAVSAYTATATTDVEVVRVAFAEITEIINRHADLAGDFNEIINRRQATLSRIVHGHDGTEPSSSSNRTNGYAAPIQGNVP